MPRDGLWMPHTHDFCGYARGEGSKRVPGPPCSVSTARPPPSLQRPRSVSTCARNCLLNWPSIERASQLNRLKVRGTPPARKHCRPALDYCAFDKRGLRFDDLNTLDRKSQ